MLRLVFSGKYTAGVCSDVVGVPGSMLTVEPRGSALKDIAADFVRTFPRCVTESCVERSCFCFTAALRKHVLLLLKCLIV
jgi:hypothetical protein